MSHAVRLAIDTDVPSITKIYNDAVAYSTAVFTETLATASERLTWMRSKVSRGYPVFVAEGDEQVVGFASFGDFRAWPGYRYSVEHSVYVQADSQGRGHGSELMTALVQSAKELGKHLMIAGIEAGNRRSIDFHSRIGFKLVGVLHGVGRKHGRWLDLAFMECMIDAVDTSRPD